VAGCLTRHFVTTKQTVFSVQIDHPPTLAEQKAVTGPRILFAASLVVTAVFAAITLSVLPREALVPVTITFVFLLGAVAALVASQTSVSTQQFTYWDAAGLLAAIGMIACAMVEPVELARLVDDDSRP
jgi:cytochrome c oxidase assembly factor CtaG